MCELGLINLIKPISRFNATLSLRERVTLNLEIGLMRFIPNLGVLQEKFKKLELEDTSLKEDQKNTNVKRKKVMQLQLTRLLLN